MGNLIKKKEFKKDYHMKFSDFLVKNTEGYLVMWKKKWLLDRSTEINTQVAHFIRWSLRLKNELKIDEHIRGYAGIGIISENALYEASMSGFVKNETFGRLKQLNREGCIIAVQKCNEIDPEIGKLDQEICEMLDNLSKLTPFLF